ncbi:hypothetical protein FH972_024192 [Carpinus fangiana]|uniref:Uncharacterized protein n=1 Tax=Carpinus fangiana TaxID=176857 RepID=A0A5N6KXB7_9ROSI|nr:hypothetical protein FH972_024192 [Carpinus fangiana]
MPSLSVAAYEAINGISVRVGMLIVETNYELEVKFQAGAAPLYILLRQLFTCVLAPVLELSLACRQPVGISQGGAEDGTGEELLLATNETSSWPTSAAAKLHDENYRATRTRIAAEVVGPGSP